jgi:ABC-type multidrug transport system ATPase subunit
VQVQSGSPRSLDMVPLTGAGAPPFETTIREPLGERDANPPATAPLLELCGITKRWRGLEHPVLDDVDLAMPGGTAALLSGRNGIGKTTLLRIASGLIGSDAGRVSVAGLDPVADRRSFQSRTGFLSAGMGGLYARLTVEWHLHWWARLALLPAAARRGRVEDTLSRFALGDLAHRRVDRLSSGQRQRLRLAGTFLHGPDVLLLDEPRNGLDTEGGAILRSAVADAVERGAAVLWCQPDRGDEPYPFDRLLVLERGTLLPA